MMTKQFEIAIFSREILLQLIEGLSEAQLNIIPNGFKNNIAWNLGHIFVTQQLLTYKLSGLQCNVSNDFIEKFTKGSTAKPNISIEKVNHIKNSLIELINQTEKDYKSGKFKEYHKYTTSQGFSLNNIEEAIQFSNYHEGIHIGIIMSLKKLL